jgi:hypothetical protein
MPNAIAYLDESTSSAWERTLYAFLAEKQRRSARNAPSSPTAACCATLRSRRQDAGPGHHC